MTLRKRLFWVFSFLLTLVMLGLALLGHQLLLARLDLSDRQTLDKAATQVRQTLESQARHQLSRLDGLAVRLALTGLAPEELPGELDFILHLDAQRRVNPLLARLPDAEWQPLRQALELPGRPPAASSIRLEWLLEQPLMLFSVPLSDGSGQLFAGRRLTPEQLTDEDAFPGLRLSFVAPDGAGASAGTLDAPVIQQQRTPVVSDAQRLHSELHLHLPHTSQGLRVQISLPRQAYLQGRQAFHRFLALSLATLAGTLLLAWLSVELFLLRRIRFMQREIAAIGLDGRSARLTRLLNDELGSLGEAVNRMLDRLDSSEARDRAILDAIDDGYFEIESDGTVRTVNRGLERQVGLRAKDLIGRDLAELLGTEELARVRQQLRQAIDGEVAPRFVVPIRRRNGSLGYFETRVTLIRDAAGNYQGVRGILHDIGDQVAFQEQLYDLAHRDPLTGLGNRMAFTEHLQHHWEEAARGGRSLALLFLDLDRFKEVNDRFGHATGDALLSAIAERMHATVRQPDLLYRLGGDEFTLLLPDTDLDQAVGIAQRLRAALAQPYQLSGQAIDFVLPSIGIALYPRHADSPDALIHAADEAMYQAKLEGLGYCISQG